MTQLVMISLLKSFLIFSLLSLGIFLIFMTESLISKVLSRGYYNTQAPHPFYRLIKLLSKQESIPEYAASSSLFRLIPALNLFFALLPAAVLPWCEPFFFSGTAHKSELFVSQHGVLFFFAFSSLAILPVLWSGWLAQKNVTILSSMRAAYREISCKIPLLMTVFSMVLFYRSSDLGQIVLKQGQTYWGIAYQPLAALIFFVALMAEIGKAPFDTAESLSELNGGYLSEYSGIQSFFLVIAEYVNLIVFTIIFIHLFLGGYQLLPGLQSIAESLPFSHFFLQGVSLFIKVIFLVILYTIIKLAIPRYRHQDLMNFGQKQLLPLSFINLLVVIAGQLYREFGNLS